MKTVYEASNAVEAHMIADLLNQEGVKAHVQGEYLQGAIGELPPAGLVRLVVDESEYERARRFIQRWEAAQPDEKPETQPQKNSKLLTGLVLGVAIGTGITYAFLRSPVTTDGIDYNRDGVLDEKWIYAPSGRPVRTEIDRNLDGKVDYISKFDPSGIIESAESDDDFNGSFETRMRFRTGNVERSDTDTDGDGFADLRVLYKGGVVVTNEFIHPNTGYPLRIEHYRLGKLTKAEIDTNADGVVEAVVTYSPLGEALSHESVAKR